MKAPRCRSEQLGYGRAQTISSQLFPKPLDMEKASDEEGAADEPSEGESEFVEVDPNGRYGRYNEVLGKGAYKTVYKAFDDLNGIEVAWNQVKIHDVVHTAGDMERLFSELHLLKTLKHKNIIKFYTSWVDTRSKNVNFITEIFTSGTLRQYRKKHRHVNLRAIKHWSRQILRGLIFLHSRDPPIIHRDLKCDNIFINGNNGEVKIGDLGLATILRRASTAQSVIGTPEFMAPELYEEHYNELVDIYSFGMCLLEMLTSEYPYSECTNAAQIYRKVTMGKKPAVLSKISDPETRKFVEKCLASASERLQARELLMDPFLSSDEDLWTLEPSHHTIVNPNAGFRSLDPIPEDSHVRSIIPSDQKISEISKSSQSSSPRKGVLGLGNTSTSEQPHTFDSSSPKEGLKSSKDFRIKGRKQDDKKVLVRIRIASSGGEVRVIQFDFDVDADTAMSVANEMVTELDLSDQDVSTIADMIDEEILALIPDWKPGLALDEALDEVVTEQKEPIEDNSESQEVRAELPVVHTPETTIAPSDDPQSVSGPGPTYGRFEEVGCTVIGSDLQQEESDGLGFFSDFSSEGSGSDSSLDARSSSDTVVDNDSTVQSFKSVETDTKSDSLRNIEAEGGEGKEDNVLPLGSDDKLCDSEVGRLMMQQKEELEILRSKHELALLDLKTHLAQNASRSENKDLPKKNLTNEFVQLSGSLEMALSDIKASKSEASVDQVEDASGNHGSTSTLTGPLSQDTLAESRHSEGSLFAENASPILISPSDLSSGRNTLKTSVVEESVSKSKTVLNEVAALDESIKKTPIINGGEVKGAVTEIVGTLHTQSKPNACLEKGTHSCAVSKPTIELNGLESRRMPTSHEDAKPGLTSVTKRESYLELYKAPNNKDNISKSKSSELLATGDGVSKVADANQEQLKKQQLQKSIADLEAKTLENLSQSRNKYFVGTGVKNHSGVTLQNGVQGATVKNHGGANIQTSQQGASVKNLPGATIPNSQQGVTAKNLPGATIPNSQQGVTAKNLPGATIQSGQQGVTVKNVPGASIQNGQQSAMIKNLPAATIQNTQQVAMKSHPGATLQNGQQSATSKGLPGGAAAQNSQQSASVKNPTGPAVQPGSAVKNHPGATLQNGQQSAMGKALAGASSQQGSTAAHARQQHMQSETTRA